MPVILPTTKSARGKSLKETSQAHKTLPAYTIKITFKLGSAVSTILWMGKLKPSSKIQSRRKKISYIFGVLKNKRNQWGKKKGRIFPWSVILCHAIDAVTSCAGAGNRWFGLPATQGKRRLDYQLAAYLNIKAVITLVFPRESETPSIHATSLRAIMRWLGNAFSADSANWCWLSPTPGNERRNKNYSSKPCKKPHIDL